MLAKCDKNAWVVIQKKQLGYEVTLNGVNERGIKESWRKPPASTKLVSSGQERH